MKPDPAFTAKNDEVYYAANKIVKISKGDLSILKGKARQNRRLRCRLCTHKDARDKVHEMFILYAKDAYIRPHKHPGKSVSYHIVEGNADVVLFSESGEVVEVIRMGDYSSGLDFYFRISDPYYYIPIPKSDFLIFEEITGGPFDDSHTVFAPWAPEESDKIAVKKFMGNLEKEIKNNLHLSKARDRHPS